MSSEPPGKEARAESSTHGFSDPPGSCDQTAYASLSCAFQMLPGITRPEPALGPVGSVPLPPGQSPYQSCTHSQTLRSMSCRPSTFGAFRPTGATSKTVPVNDLLLDSHRHVRAIQPRWPHRAEDFRLVQPSSPLGSCFSLEFGARVRSLILPVAKVAAARHYSLPPPASRPSRTASTPSSLVPPRSSANSPTTAPRTAS